MRIRLWADIPLDKAASGLEVEIPLPAHVTRVHCEVDQPGAAALQVRQLPGCGRCTATCYTWQGLQRASVLGAALAVCTVQHGVYVGGGAGMARSFSCVVTGVLWCSAGLGVQ